MDMRCYDLEENEPLDGQQTVTIKERDSGRVIWTKTRELVDDEIVSTVFDSLHHPRWTVKRPTRGWYLILQRASPHDEEPEPYIELTPSKRRRAGRNDVDLEFRLHASARPILGQDGSPPPKSPSCRVDMSPASSAMSPAHSSASAASSATPLRDPSSSSTMHRKARSSISSPPGAPRPLPPSSGRYRVQSSFPQRFEAHTEPAGGRSLLGRLRSWVVEPPKRFCCVRVGAEGESAGESEAVEGSEVVMAFEETTSGFFRPRLAGTLSLSTALVDQSGLEPSFWAALACAYADVMEEWDGWEAAKGGD